MIPAALLVRRPDWRGRLSACIEGALQRPFEWGVHDCMLFVADAVLAMTDTDLAADWRGRYRTERGAVRLVRVRGLDRFTLARSLLPEVAPARASVGDVAIIRAMEDATFGVFTGPQIAVVAPDRLTFMPRGAASHALHVPVAGEDA